MARKSKPVFDATQLLEEFKVYDQAVDVVSCYHWLFTAVAEMAETVRHFDRYPRVPVDAAKTVTPDFTVVFTDGTGLAGEIARIALRDESVDSVCSQLRATPSSRRCRDRPTGRGRRSRSWSTRWTRCCSPPRSP